MQGCSRAHLRRAPRPGSGRSRARRAPRGGRPGRAAAAAAAAPPCRRCRQSRQTPRHAGPRRRCSCRQGDGRGHACMSVRGLACGETSHRQAVPAAAAVAAAGGPHPRQPPPSAVHLPSLCRACTAPCLAGPCCRASAGVLEAAPRWEQAAQCAPGGTAHAVRSMWGCCWKVLVAGRWAGLVLGSGRLRVGPLRRSSLALSIPQGRCKRWDCMQARSEAPALCSRLGPAPAACGRRPDAPKPPARARSPS